MVEIRFGQAVSGGGGAYIEDELVYSDDSNRVAGPLSNIPSMGTEFVFWDPVLQKRSEDYSIRSVMGGTSPGYYVCLASNSSAPGGGSFVSGSNPTNGITGIETDDLLRVLYLSP